MSLWVPVAAYMALLYSLSAQTDVGPIPGDYDKLLHAVAYAVLGMLTMRAFHGGLRPVAWLPTVGALLLAACYAALDEWHQSHVPGRDSSSLDWLADVAGAAICIPLFAICSRVGRRMTSIGKHE